MEILKGRIGQEYWEALHDASDHASKLDKTVGFECLAVDRTYILDGTKKSLGAAMAHFTHNVLDDTLIIPEQAQKAFSANPVHFVRYAVKMLDQLNVSMAMGNEETAASAQASINAHFAKKGFTPQSICQAISYGVEQTRDLAASAKTADIHQPATQKPGPQFRRVALTAS